MKGPIFSGPSAAEACTPELSGQLPFLLAVLSGWLPKENSAMIGFEALMGVGSSS